MAERVRAPVFQRLHALLALRVERAVLDHVHPDWRTTLPLEQQVAIRRLEGEEKKITRRASWAAILGLWSFVGLVGLRFFNARRRRAAIERNLKLLDRIPWPNEAERVEAQQEISTRGHVELAFGSFTRIPKMPLYVHHLAEDVLFSYDPTATSAWMRDQKLGLQDVSPTALVFVDAFGDTDFEAQIEVRFDRERTRIKKETGVKINRGILISLEEIRILFSRFSPPFTDTLEHFRAFNHQLNVFMLGATLFRDEERGYKPLHNPVHEQFHRETLMRLQTGVLPTLIQVEAINTGSPIFRLLFPEFTSSWITGPQAHVARREARRAGRTILIPREVTSLMPEDTDFLLYNIAQTAVCSYDPQAVRLLREKKQLIVGDAPPFGLLLADYPLSSAAQDAAFVPLETYMQVHGQGRRRATGMDLKHVARRAAWFAQREGYVAETLDAFLHDLSLQASADAVGMYTYTYRNGSSKYTPASNAEHDQFYRTMRAAMQQDPQLIFLSVDAVDPSASYYPSILGKG